MKILAATDGSPRAEAAVRFAAWLATGLRSARLEVVLVGDVGAGLIADQAPSVLRTRQAMEKEYRRWARQALDRAGRIALRLSVRAQCRYLQADRLSPIARVISGAADAARADLIIVGSAGRGAVGRAVFGSVTRRLIQVAPRPVLIVPAPVAVRRGDSLRILAATDGSRGSAAAIRFAASLVKQARRGSLRVLTVSTLRRDLGLAVSSGALSLPPYPELRRSERRATDRILKHAAAAARGAGARVKLEFLEPRTTDPVADQIAGQARRDRAHLVAVGGEGRGAVERWALGSVTGRLLGLSRRPVLVVRPPGRRKA